ncbi:uncharacterized protein B0T23DRAFT_406790 [Neurospora hispaniola]|uniref:Uncharacterized protein n=1 Tax=Neurospora hispaniola TaxID=588809 RepID=A0AAJ0I1N0_9PEZI|nr:hypothetical protein B0T23DRAFT_406790 [Neurospora hispaniola]
MSWDLTRRRWMRRLNSKYIFDRFPLLHAIVFIIEMTIIARLTSRFNQFYNERPGAFSKSHSPNAAVRVAAIAMAVLTMMVTNAVLAGVADTVAQSITAVRQRAVRKYPPGRGPNARDDFVAYEIHELDRKNPLNEQELIPESRDLPPPFDFERLTRFMAFGFCMAPLQFKWFGFLERCFPITKKNAYQSALKRVAFDQLIFAPFGLACFFTAMTLAEGGGKRGVYEKMRDLYVPTLKANYVLWPAVQVINFRLMPVSLQLPFVSTVGIAWTAYLSLTNAAEDVQHTTPHRAPGSPDIRLS